MKEFLRELASTRAGRELREEIDKIAHDPLGRGTAHGDGLDPEFHDLRIGLGVAGYAIFYIPLPNEPGVYVASIKPWDFS